MDDRDFVHIPSRVDGNYGWYDSTPRYIFKSLWLRLSETIAFHGGIILTCYFIMKITDLFQSWRSSSSPSKSSIRQHFQYVESSCTNWSPSVHLSRDIYFQFVTHIHQPLLLLPNQTVSFIPSDNMVANIHTIPTPNRNPFSGMDTTPLENQQKLHHERHGDPGRRQARSRVDRQKYCGWNVGWFWFEKYGLSSINYHGHLLTKCKSVILDIHPVFTTIIILSGWAAKTIVATLVSRWVGGDEMTTQAWLAYSIPWARPIKYYLPSTAPSLYIDDWPSCVYSCGPDSLSLSSNPSPPFTTFLATPGVPVQNCQAATRLVWSPLHLLLCIQVSSLLPLLLGQPSADNPPERAI